MKPDEIFKILGRKVNHRNDIYFAPEKIDKYFKDLGILSSEFNKTSNEGAELGANVFFFSPRIKKGRSISKKILLDSRDKAKVIYEHFTSDEKDKNLIHHLGNGSFFEPEEVDNKGKAELKYSVNLFSKLENDLTEEEKALNKLIREEWKRQSKKYKTILYTFKIDQIIFASIANYAYVDDGMFMSYSPCETHGLLGIVERKLRENLVLVNPFWIWYEQ